VQVGVGDEGSGEGGGRESEARGGEARARRPRWVAEARADPFSDDLVVCGGGAGSRRPWF
jgi:hypothetical protein